MLSDLSWRAPDDFDLFIEFFRPLESLNLLRVACLSETGLKLVYNCRSRSFDELLEFLRAFRAIEYREAWAQFANFYESVSHFYLFQVSLDAWLEFIALDLSLRKHHCSPSQILVLNSCVVDILLIF